MHRLGMQAGVCSTLSPRACLRRNSTVLQVFLTEHVAQAVPLITRHTAFTKAVRLLKSSRHARAALAWYDASAWHSI